MKKDHSAVSQIPNRRQLLPCPPSKLSPQKTAIETTQKESRNGNAASVDGGQKQHQIKQVIKFIQSTHCANFIRMRKAISRTIQHRSDPNGNIINLAKH